VLAGTIASTSAVSCFPSTKTIKLASTTGKGIGIVELEAYDSSGKNISPAATVTSSSTRGTYSPELAVDGDTSTYFLTETEDEEAWLQLQFDQAADLSRIVIKNKFCGDISDESGCLCRLSNAQLQVNDGDGKEIMMENLQDTCGKVILSTDEIMSYMPDCEVPTPTDFGSVYDAIDNSGYSAREAASDNAFTQHAADSPTLTKFEALKLIEVLKEESIPHQCNVAITRDLSADFEKHPVVFCSFNVPIGLFCTAEIQATTCDQFTSPSQGEIYSHGVASAIYIPDITEADRMMDVYNSSYCARIDVYYGEESIFDKTFTVNLTYRNYMQDGKYGFAASLSEDDNTPKFDGGSIGLGIMIGFIFGSIITLAVGAMANEKKKKKQEVKASEITSLTGKTDSNAGGEFI
jgi:hypothetical protein